MGNLDLVDLGRKWAKNIDFGKIPAPKWAKCGKIRFSEKFGKTAEKILVFLDFRFIHSIPCFWVGRVGAPSIWGKGENSWFIGCAGKFIGPGG